MPVEEGMAREVSKPHDNLFRSVFREESEAAGLLRAHLPDAIESELQWSSLKRQDVTFIDKRLRDSGRECRTTGRV